MLLGRISTLCYGSVNLLNGAFKVWMNYSKVFKRPLNLHTVQCNMSLFNKLNWCGGQSFVYRILTTPVLYKSSAWFKINSMVLRGKFWVGVTLSTFIRDRLPVSSWG